MGAYFSRNRGDTGTRGTKALGATSAYVAPNGVAFISEKTRVNSPLIFSLCRPYFPKDVAPNAYETNKRVLVSLDYIILSADFFPHSLTGDNESAKVVEV